MEFGWVTQPAHSSGIAAQDLIAANRRFLQLLDGRFASAWVEDHFQWERRDTLECWTTLAWLAAEFPHYLWGSLVLGQSYRNPALTAKMAATLATLTCGRMVFGLGAGWKQDEYRAYGYAYPPPAVRVEQLAEAVEITRLLWTEAPVTFHGKHYQVENAYCLPHPDPLPPIMIGGGGERLLLRVAARFADWWNAVFLSPEVFQLKLEVLKRHCAEVGRDYGSIRKTAFHMVSLAADERARASDDPYVIAGDPDAVTRTLEVYRSLGCDHVMLRFRDYPSTRGAELFVEKVLPRF